MGTAGAAADADLGAAAGSGRTIELLLYSELPDLDEEHLACIEKVEGALGSGWFLVKGAETTRAIRGLERNGVPGLAASGSDSPCTASKR